MLTVQKYGGSSLADTAMINAVALKVIEAKKAGDVVVVVSAMGDTTDRLIALAEEVSGYPSRRELDKMLSTGEMISGALLSMSLIGMGYKAVSLTGADAGIMTDGIHGNADILTVNPGRMLEELSRDNIVVIAGFQGATGGGETTTLGRGGSDTTAVAVASALNADMCEIYTDVDGVYTADPRIVDGARRIIGVGYEEMLEMASVGAAVMSSRAVALAWRNNVPVLVASAFASDGGTTIGFKVPGP